MRIKIINDSKEWDDFLIRQDEVLFTQYSNYGKFYKTLKEKTWLVGVYNNKDVLVGGSLIVSVHAKRGNFLFLPYGPIIDYEDANVFTDLMLFIRNLAKQSGYDFIRVSPFIDEKKRYQDLFTKSGFRKAPIHMLAESTWLLDLSISEKELLRNMKKNHRNLINRCLRMNVQINKTTSDKSLGKLNDLHDVTARKHKFHRFSREYIKNEFRAFEDEDEALIFEAYLPKKTLDASAIIMFKGNMAAYRHSASLNINHKLPTSYLIQWKAICEAKRRGKKFYNFWGVVRDCNKKNHPFAGISHFKKGFGGFQKNLLPCQDLPITSKYWLTYIIEIVRKIKRGF